jgi:hypothetical protein
MIQTDNIKMVVTHDRKERQPITAVLQKWGFSANLNIRNSIEHLC